MKVEDEVNREFAAAVRALDVERMGELLDRGALLHEGFGCEDDVDCVWNAFIDGAEKALRLPLEILSATEARDRLKKLREIGEFLISRGANINYEPKDGFTGLFDAVHTSVDMTALFLSLGANPNVVCHLDWGNETVLSHVLDDDWHYVHESDMPYFELEQLLLSFGAKETWELQAEGPERRRKLKSCQLPEKGSFDGKVGFMGENCGLTEGQKSLYRLCQRKGASAQIKDLLNKGVDPNFEFRRMDPISAYSPIEEWMEYWDAPIHYAAANYDVETVRLMIEKGANPKVKDFWQSEPLHYAAGAHNLEMIKFLVNECGNDPGWQNMDGIIPYWLVRDIPEMNKWMVEKAKEYDPEHEEWYEEDER